MNTRLEESVLLPGDLAGSRLDGQARGLALRLRAALAGTDARELAGGLFLFALGLFATLYAQRYAFGTVTRMGPGFFPVVLGTLLCGYGALIALLAVLRRERPQAASSGTEAAPDEAPEPVRWTNLALVTLGLMAFGALLDTAGAVVATLVSVGLYTWADRGCTVRRSAALAAATTALTCGLFVWALRMPLPLWWG